MSRNEDDWMFRREQPMKRRNWVGVGVTVKLRSIRDRAQSAWRWTRNRVGRWLS